jgi:hypothetical protein
MCYSSTYGLDSNDTNVKLTDKDSIRFENTKALVASNNFKFFAGWMQNEMATREPVVPIRNYIYVSDEAVRCQLQYESFRSLSEPRNGDYIYDGEVTKYEVITDEKRKTINITYYIKFRASTHKVNMFISANGNTSVTLAQRDLDINMIYHGKIE